jgi:L-ascorbate metabolism protein UlaG (beta-lactamase superfamily)
VRKNIVDNKIEYYLENRECVVWYLGHSGWAIKTKNNFLIFDYTEMNTVVEDKEIRNSFINSIDLKNDNVYVFVSHEHEDHYDKIIYNWGQQVKNIKYILGWDDSESSKYICVGANKVYNIDDIEIITIESTDDGVGYLVKLDGLSILHFGDHANWCCEIDSYYKEQIDYLKDKCANIDIAFIPIAKGSGIRPQSITDGAEYAINKLNIKMAFPMHGGGRENLYKEFEEEVKLKLRNSKIICAEKPDDMWRFSL